MTGAGGEIEPAAGEPADGDAQSARALAAIDRGARVVMVLGGAGTGKTTFLHRLRREPRGRQVFLAPTGVAALQVGGQTIHSFFGIPPRLQNPDEVKPRVQVRRLLKKLDRVVIDEISMVRADLLDAVDISLRIARDSSEPFGGVQMVLVGDFLQLPPVVPMAEQEMLGRMGYEGPFAFQSKALAEQETDGVPFTHVHRQTDRGFIAMLDALRRGRGAREAAEALNAACVRPHRDGAQPVLLTPTNARADAYNARGLAALPGEGRAFGGLVKGEFGLDGDRLPVPEQLVLKPGARVMALRNDPARRWVNGSVGTVLGLGAHSAVVKLDTGPIVEIEAFTWERIRYGWDEPSGRLETQVVGTFTQLPLAPAWALTMHKAQGLTLDDVRIDFGDGAFAPGQAYVALSRARSLEGLSLVREIRGTDVRVNRKVAAFMEAFEQGA
ncbi:ATP-dependent DNA helicase [Xanthobacter tagetidis]|uniref:ATP-dependent DNA helicase n=1 Tax=Xanthobacter tagetidis TaxID=60216 RepID=UPI00180DCEF3|nr:DEAD/DEAH box helicase [Xanthobacter tagetidis]MBB6307332.1 ATP-dependent exoDNAse (exonuclease V) alpha subunit [Xanthobacter tagetidis]